MGVLILKVGPGSNYRDGDVISTISDRRIRQVQLEHACHIKWCKRIHQSYLPTWSRPYVYQMVTHQYQFVREGNEVYRFDQNTGKVDAFSSIPRYVDKQWQAIHIEEYLLRRLAHPRNRIYGEPGQQIWFGGQQDYSWEALTQVQLLLGLHVSNRWPAGRLDLRHHLVLPIDALTDEQAEEVSNYWVNWRRLFNSVMRERIEHRGKSVDLQGVISFPISVIDGMVERRQSFGNKIGTFALAGAV